MVASINKQYLSGNPQLELIGTFHNGQEALDYCLKNPVDLAIADYYMPVMNGLELIRGCRREHLQLDFIMITAANQTENITSCMRLGAVDYLIKPFTYERFQEAINRFLKRKEVLHSGDSLDQSEIDRLLALQQSASSNAAILEKGLQKKTLELVRDYFLLHPDEYLTNDEIAKRIGLSRITVRRYVNYLMDTGALVSEIDYSTGGRPSIRYKYKN